MTRADRRWGGAMAFLPEIPPNCEVGEGAARLEANPRRSDLKVYYLVLLSIA